jgi:hypothetical protein
MKELSLIKDVLIYSFVMIAGMSVQIYIIVVKAKLLKIVFYVHD